MVVMGGGRGLKVGWLGVWSATEANKATPGEGVSCSCVNELQECTHYTGCDYICHGVTHMVYILATPASLNAMDRKLSSYQSKSNTLSQTANTNTYSQDINS